MGEVPAVPVTVRVNEAGLGTAVQLTVKTFDAILAVQPVGAALVVNETDARLSPLIVVTEIVEEPVPVPVVGMFTVIEGADR